MVRRHGRRPDEHLRRRQRGLPGRARRHPRAGGRARDPRRTGDLRGRPVQPRARARVGHPAPVRLLAARLLAALFAVTWLLFPGFGLVDLSVSWDPGWPVVLEASWGLVMTVLVGGSLVAVAVRPRATAA